ncbi:hypothetical protein KEM52_001626, partial [Ascosphaera acerosa]
MAFTPERGGGTDAFMLHSAWPDDFSDLVDFGYGFTDATADLGAETHSQGPLSTVASSTAFVGDSTRVSSSDSSSGSSNNHHRQHGSHQAAPGVAHQPHQATQYEPHQLQYHQQEQQEQEPHHRQQDQQSHEVAQPDARMHHPATAPLSSSSQATPCQVLLSAKSAHPVVTPMTDPSYSHVAYADQSVPATPTSTEMNAGLGLETGLGLGMGMAMDMDMDMDMGLAMGATTSSTRESSQLHESHQPQLHSAHHSHHHPSQPRQQQQQQPHGHEIFAPPLGVPDTAPAFTPLISPDTTPLEHQFRVMPQFPTSLPPQYLSFSPLTSPAIEAMSMPQSLLDAFDGAHSQPSHHASHLVTAQEASLGAAAVSLHGLSNDRAVAGATHAGMASTPSTSSSQPAKSLQSMPTTSFSAPSTPFIFSQQQQQQQQRHLPSTTTIAPSVSGTVPIQPSGMVRQSPSILAQKRKVGQPEPGSMTAQQTAPETIAEVDESGSIALTEALMPPPALPDSSSSPAEAAQATSPQTTVAAAITPATLMRLQRRRKDLPRSSPHGRKGSRPKSQLSTPLSLLPELSPECAPDAAAQPQSQPMEDIQLPQQALPLPCTVSQGSPAPVAQTSAATHVTSSTPSQSASSMQQPRESATTTVTITAMQSQSSQSQPVLQSSPSGGDKSSGKERASKRVSTGTKSSSASPSILPKRKSSSRSLAVLTPKLAPTSEGNGTGAAYSGPVRVGPSPAIQPKLSPCIPANGGGAAPGGAASSGTAPSKHLQSKPASYEDLASKSNYQRILEGSLLPGVSYPETLTENLSSKRKNHKLAEQGRRNRINLALKEMEALIPAEFAEKCLGRRASATLGAKATEGEGEE